jgi:hypothetical protein
VAGTFAAAFTDRASMIPADGSAFRPAASRVFARSRSWNSLISWLSRQRTKNAYTRFQQGKSIGIERHLMPLSTRWRIASIICRWQ